MFFRESALDATIITDDERTAQLILGSDVTKTDGSHIKWSPSLDKLHQEYMKKIDALAETLKCRGFLVVLGHGREEDLGHLAVFYNGLHTWSCFADEVESITADDVFFGELSPKTRRRLMRAVNNKDWHYFLDVTDDIYYIHGPLHRRKARVTLGHLFD